MPYPGYDNEHTEQASSHSMHEEPESGSWPQNLVTSENAQHPVIMRHSFGIAGTIASGATAPADVNEEGFAYGGDDPDHASRLVDEQYSPGCHGLGSTTSAWGPTNAMYMVDLAYNYNVPQPSMSIPVASQVPPIMGYDAWSGSSQTLPSKSQMSPMPAHISPAAQGHALVSTQDLAPADMPITASENDPNFSVPCPYGCGTILTGEHALGNLTRHLKSRACQGSGRDLVRYRCPIQGCDREYARSDGLRVHMRRRHNAPQPPLQRESYPDNVD